MSLQSDLIQYIVLLNTDASTRVFHEQAEQTAVLPFIATTEISGSRPTDLSGRGLLARSQIRLALFATKAQQTEAMATAIRAALGGFRGMLGDTQVASVRVETSSDEVSLSDGDTIVKGKALDLFFVYY